MESNVTSKRNITYFPSCYYLDRFTRYHPAPLHVAYIVNCTLNAVLSVTAVLGNAIILRALPKSSTLRPPSRALLFSLALSDFAVGFVVQPLYVIYKIAEHKNNHFLYCIAGTGFHLSANVFSAASFLTVVAISIDRWLALFLGIKYQSTVSLKRVIFVIVTLWALTGLWVLTWLRSIRLYQVFNIIATSLCLVVSLATYASLWLRIRQIKTNATSQGRTEGRGKERRTRGKWFGNYKRSVMSMLYIYILLLVCNAPYLAMFIVFETTQVNSAKIVALSFTITILFTNSTFNPFIYCWRIKEIREEVFSTITGLFSSNEGQESKKV